MNSTTDTQASSNAHSWMLFGVRRPSLTLFLGLILMILLASGLKYLYKDTRADAFLQEDNPALVYKNKVRETFGLSDPLVIAIEDKSEEGIYRPETLGLIARLTDDINRLEWVNAERTISLATENNIVGSEVGLDVEPFYDMLEVPGNSPRDIRAAIKDFPLYDGMLVSEDDAMSVIVVELYDDSKAEQTYNAVMSLTQKVEKPANVSIHVAGEGAVLGYLGHYIDRDASRLNPLAGLIITIMLVVAFRRFLPALLGNLVIAASVLMTLGFMAYCGVPFYVITNAMPVILIGMAVADSIHIFSHYYECQAKNPSWDRKACVEAAVSAMFRPVTLTTLTTMAGFLGLYASSYMPPFESFGLFTAFGVLVAWLYSVFVMPALLSLLKPKVSKRWVRLEQNSQSDVFATSIASLGRLSTRKPAVTVSVFLVLSVIGAALATQLRVNENRINTFDTDEPIYQADKAINAHLEGTNTIDLVIATPEEEGIFEPEVLRRMEALQVYAESLPHVNGSASVVDYLKQMNKSLNEGRQEFYQLPASKELVAQYFLLYSASGDSADFEDKVDYDYRLANIRLHLDTAEFAATAPVIESLRQYIGKEFNSELATASLSGRVNVNFHWIKDLGISHLMSVVISLICVCLVSALLFRSLVAGLLATMPVVYSILIVYSAMAILGIDLGIGTSMFAAVAIGLGIDFSIHTLDRLRTMVRAGGRNLDDLMNGLYRSTGRALLFNFLAIAAGFGVLISSKVVPLTHFGTIVVLSVTMSFLAAMTLLPAIVLMLRPRFIFGGGSVEGFDTPKATGPLGSVGRTSLVFLMAAVLVTAAVSLPPRVFADTPESAPDALDIIKKVNEVDDGDEVSSNLRMVLTDKHGKQRERTTDTYRKYFDDAKKTVFFYRKPANLKGTGFLTFDYADPEVDDDQWLYLPALRKVRRISASNRGDHFMGSDFSYEDIKQNGRIEINDYHFSYLGKEVVESDDQDVPAITIEATPRNSEIAEELGYGRLKLWVNPENWIVIRTDYWDPKGKRLKTYQVSDVRKVDGIWTRHRMEVENHLTGHHTLFVFSDVDYQKTVLGTLFSTRSLVRGP